MDDLKKYTTYRICELIFDNGMTEVDEITEALEEQFRLDGKELELRQLTTEIEFAVAVAARLAPEVV